MKFCFVFLFFFQFTKSVISQAHLCPLPLHVCPVYWAYDAGLRLYPLPDLVVCADKFDPFTQSHADCTVTNPVSTYFSWYHSHILGKIVVSILSSFQCRQQCLFQKTQKDKNLRCIKETYDKLLLTLAYITCSVSKFQTAINHFVMLAWWDCTLGGPTAEALVDYSLVGAATQHVCGCMGMVKRQKFRQPY